MGSGMQNFAIKAARGGPIRARLFVDLALGVTCAMIATDGVAGGRIQ